MPYFEKILVANRGEIAVRVMRACREMGIRTVAVFSVADARAMHVREADEAVAIGPAPTSESYLNSDAIIAAARATGAAAIHPGYGFLSENAAFAEACAAAGIVFIGPPPDAIRLMGSKIAAKDAVRAVDVPTIPGYQGAEQSPRKLLREAERIGFPVMIKAAAGGGGKGMRAVQAAADFPDALAAAQREALAAFGDATVFLEKLVVRPRHIEFQIMADQQGNVLHFGERECSIQRRHQKIIEEAPSAALTPELRAAMGAAAVRAAQAARYINAGTVEFMLDQAGRYYFLEMNTRLQVEHPVTEQVTGRDLVHLQIAVAAGEPLPLAQADITPRGQSIEVRLYAEDPQTGLPATGTVLAFDPPRGPGIRLDGGVVTGDEVTMWYDPMIAKLIVTAQDRPAAVARLRAALDDLALLGLTTNAPLLRRIAADERFVRGETFTDFLDDPRYHTALQSAPADFVAALPLGAVSTARSPDMLSTARSASGAIPLHAMLIAAAYTERAAQADAPSVKRSPWAAGALRSGRFTARYVVEGATHTITLRDDPLHPGGFFALIDDALVGIMDTGEDAPIVAARVPTTGRIVLRQGTRQVRLWAVRRPADGALLVTDAHTILVCAHPQPLDVDRAAHGGAAESGWRTITAPMAGTVIQVRVHEGEMVAERQALVILGAMKMEHNLTAPSPARVRRVLCRAGEVVAGGATLVELDAINI
jgi:3-methylcrotonyl-CoA carboxylase alpha subunit